MDDRFFLVTYRFDKTLQYRAKAKSATRLKKDLPRYVEGQGYMVLYRVKEIDEKEFKRLDHLPDAPTRD